MPTSNLDTSASLVRRRLESARFPWSRKAALVRWPTLDGRRPLSASERRWLGPHAMVSWHARALYVPTPKAACTTMKWFFAQIEGCDLEAIEQSAGVAETRDMTIHDWTGHGVTLARELSEEQLGHVLTATDWLRIGLTRNPYARVVSAWFHRIATTPPKPSAQFDTSALDVFTSAGQFDLRASFERFVDELSDEQSALRRDRHFAPQVRVLAMGAVPYTHLFDVAEVCNVFSLVEERAGVRVDVSAHRNVGMDLDYRALFSAASAEVVESLYAEDFDAFGYSHEMFSDDPRVALLDPQATALLRQLRASHRRIADLSAMVRESRRRPFRARLRRLASSRATRRPTAPRH